jgi:site-specific DNA-methyltransferase (adenine-specific)
VSDRRSPRNKTLALSDAERATFGERLLTVASPVAAEALVDRTICGDTLQALDRLPGAFADLIIVDPPYNLRRNFAGQQFNRLSEEQYAEYLRSWFPALMTILKPGGSLYLCGDWRSSASLYGVMSEHLTVMNRITWQREKGRGSHSNWKNSMEDIWFGVRDVHNYYFDREAVMIKRRVMAPYRVNGAPKDWEETAEGNFRLTCPSNFWDDITVPYWSMPENTEHPTQKPEKLIAKLILASCPAGGMVFDPFLGSGTTSVVARKLGRRYCGIELSHEYACLAEKRLQEAERNPSIQGYEDGVFWERNARAPKSPKSLKF